MRQFLDADAQLDALVFPGFIARTGVVQLQRVPVYLDGIIHRVAKLPDDRGHSVACHLVAARIHAGDGS